MGTPAARLTDMTATADIITGPGAPTVLIGKMPASVAGDVVSGPVCVGAVAMGSTTVLICGRPATKLGSMVSGVNPTSGVPVSSSILSPCCPTVLIGG
jgi:uncharacterized Zn-binding protein involved in type VI secretion